MDIIGFLSCAPGTTAEMKLVDRRRRFRPNEVKKGTHSKGCVQDFPSKHGNMRQGRLSECIRHYPQRARDGAVLLALVLIMGGILLQNVRRGGRTRQAPLCSRARGSFLCVRADHGAVQKAGCVVGNNRITGVVHQLDAPYIAFEGKKQGVCDDFPPVYQ